MSIPATLMEDLGPVVDDAREIATEIGWRMREVKIQKIVWAGEFKGQGDADDRSKPVDVLTITPRPMVAESGRVVAQLVHRHGGAGMIEEGNLLVTNISMRYTEAEIKGTGLANNEEQFWNITKVADSIETDTPEATSGMFRLRYAWRRPHPLGWSVVLETVDDA